MMTLFNSIRARTAMLLLGLFFAVPALCSAHAFPDHSDPKVGSTLQTSPSQVRIWFDSSLEPVFSSIIVQDAQGGKVDKGDGRVDPSDATILEVSVPPLGPGVYKVLWNVVARDGHRTQGDYQFRIK